MDKELQKRPNNNGNELPTETAPFSLGKTKSAMHDVLTASCDPRQVLKELQTLLPKIIGGTPDYQKKQDVQNIIRKGLSIQELENHYRLAEAVDDQYNTLVIQLAHDLAIEFDCQHPSEKALAGAAAGSYVSILHMSRNLTAALQVDTLSPIRNTYMAILGKELDRAHRHLVTILATLKHLKTPPLEMHIKTQTAFIAQNQQVNADKGSNDKTNENVEPK